jgi:hypothetical protein
MVAVKGATRPPWVGLGVAVWVEIASGSTYTFPLYSHTLKSVLGLSQHQLTMIGIANDIGENIGLLPGLACDKFPPWVVLSERQRLRSDLFLQFVSPKMVTGGEAAFTVEAAW